MSVLLRYFDQGLATYESLCGCEPNSSMVDTRHQDGLSTNLLGECLGYFQRLGLFTICGMSGTRHGGVGVVSEVGREGMQLLYEQD